MEHAAAELIGGHRRFRFGCFVFSFEVLIHQCGGDAGTVGITARCGHDVQSFVSVDAKPGFAESSVDIHIQLQCKLNVVCLDAVRFKPELRFFGQPVKWKHYIHPFSRSQNVSCCDGCPGSVNFCVWRYIRYKERNCFKPSYPHVFLINISHSFKDFKSFLKLRSIPSESTKNDR